MFFLLQIFDLFDQIVLAKKQAVKRGFKKVFSFNIN